MASLFTHAVVALAAGKAASREPAPLRFYVLLAACSCLPDADVAGFAFGMARRGRVYSAPEREGGSPS